MRITLIAAAAENNALGKDNDLVWHLPDDFKRFKKLTSHHHIIMGRKTFESFPKGPLPKRINIVLTRESEKYKHLEQQYSNLLFRNIDELMVTLQKLNKEEPNKKTFVIGGTQIYEQLFPECTRIHITRIESDEDGDAENPFTEEKLKTNLFSLSEQSDVKSSKNNIAFQHITYEKC